MKGKERCRILKEIRQKIADENNIEFVTSECRHKGDCLGTCPKCESELRYLERELEKRQKLGKAVAIAGLTAVITAAGTGCEKLPLPEGMGSNHLDTTPIFVGTDHKPVETGEMVVMGDLMPGLPALYSVSELADKTWEEIRSNISHYDRSAIREEWSSIMVASAGKEDVFKLSEESYLHILYVAGDGTVRDVLITDSSKLTENNLGSNRAPLYSVSELVDKTGDEIDSNVSNYTSSVIRKEWSSILILSEGREDVFKISEESYLHIVYFTFSETVRAVLLTDSAELIESTLGPEDEPLMGEMPWSKEEIDGDLVG